MLKSPTKILGLVLTSFLAVCYPVQAQFFYPPASMFSPTANTFRGGSSDPIEWLKNHNAGILAFLLSINNLDTQLNRNNKTLTIFVPTNEAFSQLSRSKLQKLATKDNIQKLLKYHMFEGIITEEDILDQKVTTLEGSHIEIKGKRNRQGIVEVKLNDAKVENVISLNDRLVFVIVDRVLFPQDF